MISTTLSVNKKNYKNIDKQGPQPIKYPIVGEGGHNMGCPRSVGGCKCRPGVENLTKTQKFSPKQVAGDKYFLMALVSLKTLHEVAKFYIYI